MRTISIRVLSAVTLILLFAGAAFASDPSDVMKPVHQFIDGFNKGDAKSAIAACADEASIIDEFPPYEWHGAGACSTWASDYQVEVKKAGVTDGAVTLGEPKHVDVSGDHAYVVVPTTYTFKQNGKPMKESNAIMTITLQKSAPGWRITSWAWSKD
jgi:ketosteroid isomerase-like protein